MTAGPVRRRGDVLGFGLAVVLFLPGIAYLGIRNGHDFIENDFFAFMYCVACVSFASVPLLGWRMGGHWHADPGFGRITWFPWLFTTGQGMAYSGQRTGSNLFVLAIGWGAFMGAADRRHVLPRARALAERSGARRTRCRQDPGLRADRTAGAPRAEGRCLNAARHSVGSALFVFQVGHRVAVLVGMAGEPGHHPRGPRVHPFAEVGGQAPRLPRRARGEHPPREREADPAGAGRCRICPVRSISGGQRSMGDRTRA